MNNNTEVREFLERVRKENQTLATLADAEEDELVIVAVNSSVDPDKPASLRVKILGKNETCNSVLTQNSQFKYGEFELNDSCLRFNPPIIDMFWPDRHPEDEDPELAERYDPPHFRY